MPKVVLKENEVLDDALKRFKRQVSRNGALAEARKREFYVKPGVRRKLKSEAARKARRGNTPGGWNSLQSGGSFFHGVSMGRI